MSNYPPPPSAPDPEPPDPYRQQRQYGQYGQYNPYNPYGPYSGGIEHPRGTTVLVLGILSLVCCGLVAGIPAIVMGHSALKEIDATPGRYTNRSTVKAGYICGIIGTVLVGLVLVFYLIVGIVAISES